MYWDQQRDSPEYYDFIMTEKEKDLLKKVIITSKNYLEFGTGGSTIFTLENSSADIVSVDTHQLWLDHMKKYRIISKNLGKRLELIKVDIGPTKNWGFPINTENRCSFPDFSSAVFLNNSTSFDTVLIDGRFRVACTLKSILHLQSVNGLRILIHDYSFRSAYHIVEEFLHVVESADSLFVFGIKKNVDLDKIKNLYEYYKYNPE